MTEQTVPRLVRRRPAKPRETGFYEQDMTGISTTRCVAFMYEGKLPLAWLTWDKDRHTVEGLYVNEDYRGRGIATVMLDVAEWLHGKPLRENSGEYTPEGRKWARAHGIPAVMTYRVTKSEWSKMQARMNMSLWGGHRNTGDLIEAED